MEQLLPAAPSPLPRIFKLIAAALVFAACWAFVLAATARGLQLQDIQYVVAPALAIILAIPFISLAAVVLPGIAFAGVAAALTALYFFFFPLSGYTLASAALVAVGFWRTYVRTKFELGNNVKFSSYRIISRASSAMILTFLLAVSVAVYGLMATNIRSDEAGFYDRIADSVTAGVMPVVESHLPGFQPDITLDQYIINSFGGPQPAPDIEQQAVAQNRSQILDQLGITATGQEPLSEITKRAISAKLRAITHPYQSFLPFVYTLAIFLLLQTLGTIVGYAARLFGIFVFWLLRQARFLKITTTQIEAETVIV